MTNEEKRIFYDKCAQVLGIPHEFQPPPPRRTRWNNRFLGNGRFKGFGLVQIFGDSLFRIVSKQGTSVHTEVQDVLDHLQKMVDSGYR